MPRSIWTLWDEIITFKDEFFPGWRETPLIYLSNALAGEAGEVCNAVKHRLGGGTHKSNPTDAKLLEEAADVFIYLVLLAEVLEEGGKEAFIRAGYRKLKINERRMEEVG